MFFHQLYSMETWIWNNDQNFLFSFFFFLTSKTSLPSKILCVFSHQRHWAKQQVSTRNNSQSWKSFHISHHQILQCYLYFQCTVFTILHWGIYYIYLYRYRFLFAYLRIPSTSTPTPKKRKKEIQCYLFYSFMWIIFVFHQLP